MDKLALKLTQILLAFGIQAFIALALASYSKYSKLLYPGPYSDRFEDNLSSRNQSHDLEATERHEKQRSIVRDILLSGSDTQSITGEDCSNMTFHEAANKVI
ncbi:hypothetical protein HYALB_00003004 [Hymenoscyphus albidus]|uniref:Uncharacterized protein n=1 Tax=Hymenoscyphus albidus TaxID=595503 RepID=A0A9N9QE10_9HELO|nr:hypothetical protein HYALB_00003004 [Hymenoscyphus albidus]